jgi:proliferating cell nuclear antigen PCNA
MFKAKTNEGYLFKVITELLLQNIKTCCWELGDEGISLRMTDNLKKILLDIKLDANNFQIYKFKYQSKKMIGLNLTHLHKMLKSIKKKDTVEIFINDDDDNNFGIKIIPKDNTRITTSYIKIQNIQNINVQLEQQYVKPIIILSNDYQKMIKDMITIGNKIEITSTEHTINFNCIADGVYSREVMFGTPEEDEDDTIKYRDKFYADQLNKLIKLSGLGQKLHIYTEKDKPLFISCNVGTIGHINIYIKSIHQIEN